MSSLKALDGSFYFFVLTYIANILQIEVINSNISLYE